MTGLSAPSCDLNEVYFERAVRKEVGPSDTLGTAAGPPLCASHESGCGGAPERFGELAPHAAGNGGVVKKSRLCSAAEACSTCSIIS